MSFEIIKHLLSKNETRTSEDAIIPPTPILTDEPDKMRVNRNKFAKLSSRVKEA